MRRMLPWCAAAAAIVTSLLAGLSARSAYASRIGGGGICADETPIALSAATLNLGSATVTDVMTGTASLDFTALAANSCEVLTVTVTGAADGDTCSLGLPNALVDVDGATERTLFECWVSAANTVSVRRCNVTGTITANPAAATVRATVIDF